MIDDKEFSEIEAALLEIMKRDKEVWRAELNKKFGKSLRSQINFVITKYETNGYLKFKKGFTGEFEVIGFPANRLFE